MASDARVLFYRMLLNKFAPLINESEQRNIEGIKALVNPDDLSVQALLTQYRSDTYDFGKDYLFTSQRIFEFLTREIKYTPNDMNISFWLTPKEILTSKVSDDEGLATLLCTALYALGDTKASVYGMELEDLHTHAVVMTTVNEKTLLLDPSVGHGFFKYYGEKSTVFSRYRFDGKKLKRALYRFNAETYEQFI
ncbi:MAG: hypothetical protein AABY11_02580 [archaeon]